MRFGKRRALAELIVAGMQAAPDKRHALFSARMESGKLILDDVCRVLVELDVPFKRRPFEIEAFGTTVFVSTGDNAQKLVGFEGKRWIDGSEWMNDRTLSALVAFDSYHGKPKPPEPRP